ncbi:MAG: hypothetical protein MJ211_03350 [Bacteroidales bacterium]|nr:hypothetical protein [Bacteroidales bacterium]
MRKYFLSLAVCGLLFSTACYQTTTTNNNNNQSNKQNGQNTEVVNNNNNENQETKKEEKEDNIDKNSFQNANGKFSINFPGDPEGPVKSELKNKAGIIVNYQFTYQKSDNAFYFATYSDYPVGAITDSNVEEALKSQAETFMKNMGGKIEKSDSERLNGNKGLTFSGVVRDSLNVNMRSYFVGKRYYQFGTMAYNSEISDKEAKKFMNSFKLIK